MPSFAPPEWNRSARVAVLGGGLEGLSVLRALQRWGQRAEPLLLDDKPVALPADLASARTHEGAVPDELWRRVDLLVRSPGVPPAHPALLRAQQLGIPRTTATDLALRALRSAGVTVAAVTGSKGKSTTTSLLYAALRAAGREAILAGNIGRPALDLLDEALERKAVVALELSSYQCHDLTVGPHLAVLLNLFPEHLDWHGDEEAYYSSKQRLARAQREADTVLYDAANERLLRRLPLGPGLHRGFGTREGFHFREGAFWRGEERLFDDARVPLRGRHNRHNACAVLAAMEHFGLPLDAAREALESFVALPHRLQLRGTYARRRWVDDSISTAPEAAAAALEAFEGEVSVLLAGGHDRGYDFEPLLRALAASSVRAVFTLGPSGKRLLAGLRASQPALLAAQASSMEEAVRLAYDACPEGGLVLLSPGSPSYGLFRNFEERGDRFDQCARALDAAPRG